MRPAQMPFRIALIVSDAGTGGFQQGLANFMQKLLGTGRVQPDLGRSRSRRSSRNIERRRACSRRPLRVGSRGRARGAQLMESHSGGDETRRSATAASCHRGQASAAKR